MNWEELQKQHQKEIEEFKELREKHWKNVECVNDQLQVIYFEKGIDIPINVTKEIERNKQDFRTIWGRDGRNYKALLARHVIEDRDCVKAEERVEKLKEIKSRMNQQGKEKEIN